MFDVLITSLVLAANSPPEGAPSPPEVEAPHGFGIGAQTELISPSIGLSAALAAFDAGWIQAEASLGVGVFQRGANALDDTNFYGASLRAYLPVHRTSRADFSLGGGVGFNLLDTGSSLSRVWTVFAGAKVRIFVVPNVAIVGALGAGALFRDEGNAFLLGARPLGSAGFVYYFQ